MQAIVLRFDYQSSGVIENLQNQAKTVSINPNQIFPPHITLQTYTQAHPLELKKAIESWAGSFQQLPLSFDSLGFFKQQGSFFLAPVFTKSLAELHRAVDLSTREFSGQNHYYLPDHWVPHATVINNIAPPFWGPLFARLSLEFEPFQGKGIALECWSIRQEKAQTEWCIFLNE